MNIPIWQQLSLVLVGGLVALAGGLSSAWLTARLTERRQLRELLHRLHELLGRQQAIVSDAGDHEGKPIESKTTQAMFGRNDPSSEQIAFMIGLLEKVSTQAEGYMTQVVEYKRSAAELRDKNEGFEKQIKKS